MLGLTLHLCLPLVEFLVPKVLAMLHSLALVLCLLLAVEVPPEASIFLVKVSIKPCKLLVAVLPWPLLNILLPTLLDSLLLKVSCKLLMGFSGNREVSPPGRRIPSYLTYMRLVTPSFISSVSGAYHERQLMLRVWHLPDLEPSGDFTMSCFHPNFIRQRIDPDTGFVVSAFLGKSFVFSPDLSGTFDDLVSGVCNEILVPVPCGHCLGCEMDYARQWADRMVLELQTNPKAIFVTLTYRPSDLPLTDSGNPTLFKRHPQLFLKRLRRHFPNRKIRYYLCGEYGSKTLRPHYHAILYGLSLDDFPDVVLRNCNELDQPFYSSDFFADIWSYGFCLLSSVSWQTCNYVARYVTKKQVAFDYGDRLPPYNVSSRKPGLGFDFCHKMLDSGIDRIDLQCGDTVKTVTFPSTVLKRFCEYGLDKCLSIKYTKSVNCRCTTLAQIEASGLSYDHILLNKERDLRRKLYQIPDRNDLKGD